MKKKFPISLIMALALVVGIGVLVSVSSPAEIVRAGTGDNVSGWAWSENVGWISFNCTTSGNASDIPADTCSDEDYGVAIDLPTGNFSGYAWSENIGWINFAPASPYLEAPLNAARLNSDGTVTGWARACAGAVNADCTGGTSLVSGDWDGWIKMSGTADDGSLYGVSLDQNQFNGYAWGSDVVGWVDFNPAGYGGVTFGGAPSGPECSDGIDNDGDTLIDADDPRCYNTPGDETSGYDPDGDETLNLPSCSDWYDNDGDGYCDTVGGVCKDGSTPGDPDCSNPSDSESPAGGSVCDGTAITGAELCELGPDGVAGTADDNVGAATCFSQGFDSGTLFCSSDCKSFDTTACTGTGCNNNGICDGGETILSCPADCFNIREI